MNFECSGVHAGEYVRRLIRPAVRRQRGMLNFHGLEFASNHYIKIILHTQTRFCRLPDEKCKTLGRVDTCLLMYLHIHFQSLNPKSCNRPESMEPLVIL